MISPARGDQASTSQRTLVAGRLRQQSSRVSNLRTGVFQRPLLQSCSDSTDRLLCCSPHTSSKHDTLRQNSKRGPARVRGRRLGATFSDASHDLYYSSPDALPVLAGAKPKKLRKLAKRMRSRAAELQALSTRLAGEMQGGAGSAGLQPVQQRGPDAAAAAVAATELLPQMQQLHAEFLALCEAAINEMDSSSSSSSSSDSDSCGKSKARAVVVDHRQQQLNQRQTSSTAVLDRSLAFTQQDSACVPATTGRVAVCMGGACRKRGAGTLLAAFSEAAAVAGPAAAGVEVTSCKCLGKCKMGPAVELEAPGAEAPALHLGVDDLVVPDLWDSYFGVQASEAGEASAAGGQSAQPLLMSPPATDPIIGLA